MTNKKDFVYFIGVDISKNSLDITVLNKASQTIKFFKTSNTKKGVTQIINQVKKLKIDLNKTLFCCENTGLYTQLLAIELHKANLNLWIESPVVIKKSLGLVRGKNDKIDSKRIANYALTFKLKVKLFIPIKQDLEELKQCLNLRDRIIKSINILKKPIKESKLFLEKSVIQESEMISNKILKNLEKELLELNKKIEDHLKKDEEIKKNMINANQFLV